MDIFLSSQLAHGADPTMKNQEAQTALDLATVRNNKPDRN